MRPRRGNLTHRECYNFLADDVLCAKESQSIPAIFPSHPRSTAYQPVLSKVEGLNSSRASRIPQFPPSPHPDSSVAPLPQNDTQCHICSYHTPVILSDRQERRISPLSPDSRLQIPDYQISHSSFAIPVQVDHPQARSYLFGFFVGPFWSSR